VLYAWGFQRIGVVAGDLYFLDPNPAPGQEGAERGVRLEVRILERPPLTGSVYAAQPIVIDRPVWRVDLFESVAGPPGSHDRTHHHPHFEGWEPGLRQFDPHLTEDPIGWLAAQLAHLPDLLAGANLDASVVGPDDARQLAQAAEEITDRVADLLRRVRAGELAQPPEAESEAAREGSGKATPVGGEPVGLRAGWL
jgi:hypothetical protein